MSYNWEIKILLFGEARLILNFECSLSATVLEIKSITLSL